MHEKFSCHTKKQKATKPSVPLSFPKGGIYPDKPLCPSVPKGKTSQIIARPRLFFKEKLAFIITSAHLFQRRERGNFLPFQRRERGSFFPFSKARKGQFSSVSKRKKGAIFFRARARFLLKRQKKVKKRGFF